MAEINIDPKAAANYAAGIRKDQALLKEAFDILNKEIGSISDVWKDSAQLELNTDKKALSEKTSKFLDDLSAYAAYLDTVSGEYVSIEKKINKNIESFL